MGFFGRFLDRITGVDERLTALKASKPEIWDENGNFRVVHKAPSIVIFHEGRLYFSITTVRGVPVLGQKLSNSVDMTRIEDGGYRRYVLKGEGITYLVKE